MSEISIIGMPRWFIILMGYEIITKVRKQVEKPPPIEIKILRSVLGISVVHNSYSRWKK